MAFPMIMADFSYRYKGKYTPAVCVRPLACPLPGGSELYVPLITETEAEHDNR
jgi:hypothetical protein